MTPLQSKVYKAIRNRIAWLKKRNISRGVSNGEICDQIQSSPGRVWRAIEELERQGLITQKDYEWGTEVYLI